MAIDHNTIFETGRLNIRPAQIGDADLLYQLWKDPRVMTNVGFPNGLPITRDDLCQQIEGQGNSEFGRLLIAEIKLTGEAIGECKMYLPKEDGIASTDVKLLPKYWGNRYGVEIKEGLLDYLFRHTDCDAVKADPNVENIASIKMQEAVGGVRISENSYEFPPEKRHYTKPFRYYVYHAKREIWERNNAAKFFSLHP